MYNDLTEELVEARRQYNQSFGKSAAESTLETMCCLDRGGIYTSNHAMDAVERAEGACYAKPVKIGNHVWIGAGVHINQGVTIGDNTIIGSGSVVTKDIPSNVIAAGVPCKVIREITEADKTGYHR